MPKTTQEIVETYLGLPKELELQLPSTEYTKNKNKRWHSEEEIRKTIEELKYECDMGYCIDLRELEEKLNINE